MRLPRALLVVLLATATACGGSAKPNASPTPSPTPSVSPSLPPVAADTAALKKALVVAADIGTPWVVPKAVNKTGTKKGELCPGKPNERTRVKPRATAEVAMTEGTKQGAAIASFDLFAFEPAQLEAFVAAVEAANQDCAAYTSVEKLWVTTETATAPAVSGGEQVLARLERIYADKTKKTLYYVRQTLLVRVGRSFAFVEHAFIQPKTDPTGADWKKTVALAEKQVAKLAANAPV